MSHDDELDGPDEGAEGAEEAPPTPKPRRKRKKRKRKPALDTAQHAADLLSEHNQANGFVVLRHMRILGLGGTIAAIGLALVGTHDSKVGSSVVIVGLLLLMWGVHRFGRLGTERVT